MSFRELFGVDASVGDVPSPCVQICIIEPEDGLCVGCARTLDEIAGWGVMSNEARRAVVRSLSLRRAQVTKFDQ
ncbi:MAG: DUF1289 domain-containing protein [Casimicrobium sp.]